MALTKPTAAPQPNDEIDDQPIVQRITSASGQPPPATSAAASVFAMGIAAKPRRPPRAPRLKADDVVIHSGVTPPPISVGAGAVSPYKLLLERMRPGDMVELPARQSYGLLSMAKKLKIATTRRTLASGVVGVWRV